MHDMPPEWDQPATPARGLARQALAFFLATAAMGLGGAYSILVAAAMTIESPPLRQFVNDPRWDHFLGGPLVIVSVLAALLLLGGGRHSGGWMIRCLLFAVVTATGLAAWSVNHAHFFGFGNACHAPDNDPIAILMLRLIALVRVVTLAGLATDVAMASGRMDTSQLRTVAINTAAIAFLLWLFVALTHLNWQARPLAWRNIRDQQAYTMLMLSNFSRGISSVLVAALCAQAFSAARAEAEAIRKSERDLFGSPAQSF